MSKKFLKRVDSVLEPRSLAAAIGLLSLTLSPHAWADDTSDHRCVNGADIRLIEVRFTDPDGGLPCKVIYRPEAEDDNLGIVSWQDIASVPACHAQAHEVIDRLTDEGWTCTKDERPFDATVVALTAPVGADDVSIEETDVEIPSGPVSEVPIARVQPQGDDDDVVQEVDEPAKFLRNPDISPPPSTLVSLIRQDLKQLDTTLDGLLEAMIAGYGDLNDDAIDDALVLYTYNSPQPAYRQFLAAYVFDGETYQLTATKSVSGNISATMDAQVDTIDRGVIHLTLKAFEPGDASCCPSGTRDLALTLSDLELVEVDAETPTR